MLFKNVFCHKLGRYFNKMELPLRACELTGPPLNGNCWCVCENRNLSTSQFVNVKKPCFVRMLAVNFSSSSLVKPKKEQFFKRVDQVPEDFSLIYKAAIDGYVVFGRRFTSICYLFLFSVGIMKAYYLLLAMPMDVEMVPKQANPDNIFINSDSDFFTYYSSLLFFALAVQSALSKFPMRMYHNPTNDKYIAIFSNYMGNPTKLQFSKGEFEKLKPTGFLPWKDNRFAIQSKKVILMEHYFRVPADYNALLGVETSESSS